MKVVLSYVFFFFGGVDVQSIPDGQQYLKAVLVLHEINRIFLESMVPTMQAMGSLLELKLGSTSTCYHLRSNKLNLLIYSLFAFDQVMYTMQSTNRCRSGLTGSQRARIQKIQQQKEQLHEI
jgi:hypothetical protein